MKTKVEQEWNKLSLTTIRNLCDSMKKRCEQVFENPDRKCNY